MKRLSQLWVCRPPTAANFSRGAICLGTTAIHTAVRCTTTQRRVLRPTEEGVADLMDDEEEGHPTLLRPQGGAAAATGTQRPALSSVVKSASLYRRVSHGDGGAAASRKEQQQQQEEGDEDDDEDDEDGEDGEDEDGDLLQHPQQDRPSNGGSFEAGEEGGEGEETAAPASLAEMSAAEAELIAEHQAAFYEAPVQQLVDVVCAYLRATENPALVSAKEEHTLFPVLQDRLTELHVTQMLDIVECHWCRSTMLRYGAVLQDAVRDRIAELATAAATQLEATKQRAGSLRERSASGDVLPEEEENEEEEEEGIFADNKNTAQQTPQGGTGSASVRTGDVILAHASDEITSATIHRALIVTGMSAGHRKRDQVFFQLLGSFLTYYINDYRDPNELVRVLTALARAKVMPSQAFLSLLARRLPVLHKRVPLQPVPAYRAMSNFARMGHTSINTFRFLADCTVANMVKNIREERKELRAAKAKEKEEKAGQHGDATTPSAASSAASPFSSEVRHLRADAAAKQRMRRLSGLKPSTFTRLLFLLARFNAPHQQYLRPLIEPVILPMLPHFPPPSFTRLLRATQRFGSNDAALIDAFVAHVCDVLAPAGHLARVDVLNLLQLLSNEDTPVPARLDDLLAVCCTTLRSATSVGKSSEANSDETASQQKQRQKARGTETLLLRPIHMCRVLHSLGGMQRRVEMPLEALTPLVDLADDFARHLSFLLELGIVPLHEVDEFVEVCARHQIPDRSGAIEQLAERRRDVTLHPRQAKRSTDGATAAAAADGEGGDGEEDYYSQLDVDVRETFAKIFFASDFATYGGYRPLPGQMQVDLRDELTRISAFELLQAVDLFERACPGGLPSAPRMYLSRSFIEKVGDEGEVVVVEETNELVLREPQAQLLTREDLVAFVALLQRTPLEAVRTSPVTWRFVLGKAERLGVAAAAETASQHLHELQV